MDTQPVTPEVTPETSLNCLSGAIDTGPEPVRLSVAIAEWLESVRQPDQLREAGE
jgi:hypothetical protein